MATDCDMELCQYWTGHSCACEVLDIDRGERDDDDDAASFLFAGEKSCKGCGLRALCDTDGFCHDCYDGGGPIYV